MRELDKVLKRLTIQPPGADPQSLQRSMLQLIATLGSKSFLDELAQYVNYQLRGEVAAGSQLAAGVGPPGPPGEPGAGGLEIIVPNGLDATLFLQAEFDALGLAGGGHVTVRRESRADPIRIDERLQINYSNITATFQSPVTLGVRGGIRIRGEQAEDLAPGDTRPVLTANSFDDGIDGKITFPMNATDAAKLSVGDYVVVRGLVNGYTSLERMFGAIESITTSDMITYNVKLDVPRTLWEDEEDLDEYNSIMGTSLVIGDPMPFFDVYVDSGGAPVFNPVEGSQVATRITPLKASYIVGDQNPGIQEIPVLDESKFAIGDIIEIFDERIEDDISNTPANFLSQVNKEQRMVVGIATGVLRINAPTTRSYLTAFKARCTVIAAPRNTHVKIGQMSWIATGTRNFHAMQMDYCAQCSMSCREMNGWGGKVAHGLRISNSYDCVGRDTTIFGAVNWGSGLAYQATMYYSSFCRLENLHLSDGRHNILLQGVDNCDVFDCVCTNDLISGIDLHGVQSTNVRIERNRVECGKLRNATTKGGIRIGNSSHIVPDANMIVRDNWVSGYTETPDVAIDIYGPSLGCIIEGNHIQDCHRGVANGGNNSSRVLVKQFVPDLSIRNNIFKRVELAIDVDDNSNAGFNDLHIEGNVFIECDQAVYASEIDSITMLGNTILRSPGSPPAIAIDIDDIPEVRVTGNTVGPEYDGNPVLRLTDCVGAVVTRNDFRTGTVTEVTSSGSVIRENNAADNPTTGAPQVVARNPAVAVSNDGTATTVATYTLSGGELGTDKIMRMRIQGLFTSNGTTPANLRVRIYAGATEIYQDSTTTLAVNASPAPFLLDLQFAPISGGIAVGGSLQMSVQGGATIGDGGNFGTDESTGSTAIRGNTAIDLSVAQTIRVDLQNVVVEAGVGWATDPSIVEVL